MNSNSTLISIGGFDLKFNHLLVIAILSLSFSISFLIRSQPAEWGWELNEFDPFFNYRSTEFIVENGFDEYFKWHDEYSWYPRGRDVSNTSQVMLHLTAATTYSIFGGNSNLYDFTILFPAIIGSLTTIVIFALVRQIGGTTAGLFSALLFSIALPIIVRGQIGWFKSEPLGLFFGILSLYLFLSGINSKNKYSIIKLFSAGIIFILGLSAWGGNQFFLIPLGIFIFTLPFLRKDLKFLLWSIPVFTLSTITTSFLFERLSTGFVTGLGGIAIILPTLFLISCILIQLKSKNNLKIRNGLIFLLLVVVSSICVFYISLDSELLPLPTYRYLNALNPFMITSDPLIDSVSEHATTTLNQSFLFHSVLMIFAGIGIWLLFKNSKFNNYIHNDMISFCLVLGLLSAYIASSFVRLEVFVSISIIIFSSLGLSILFRAFFSNPKFFENYKSLVIKLGFSLGVVFLLTIPLIFPQDTTIFALTDQPPTILNGGTNFKSDFTDWLDALNWIKNNTPKNSVIAAWWDYGYWIQTIADRPSIADNSTLIDNWIKDIAKIFLNNPNDSWISLQEREADYFIIFVASQRVDLYGTENQPLYLLGGGGDESKKQWFIKIAGESFSKYLYNDLFSGTDYFWQNTTLGQMIPFQPVGYVNLQTNEQSLSYKQGFIGIYEKNIKFPKDENGPFKLVYSSPSYEINSPGQMVSVFVYEINDDYVPQN